MKMLTRLALVVGLLALVLQATAQAQSLEVQKAGVVRVTAQAEGLRRTGTGFIVRLEADAAFILTASHVVEGDSKPGVEFFTHRNSAIAAEVVRIEGGDPRGLALLVVRGKDKLPTGLRALPIAQSISVSGGEPVIVIGFPQGGGAWAVLRASVVSLEGRELTLDGSIGEGNSGGPVLLGERVIGVVTTVGGGGGFGRALPASLVRLVLEGWGVPLASAPVRDEPVAPAPGTPPPAVSAPPAPSASPAASGKPVPSSSGTAAAANPNAGQGQMRIVRHLCERLRSTTTFRVTLNGEGEGPEGAVIRAAFLRDGKALTQPRIACSAWKSCQRAPGDPPRTPWKISVMVLAPVPTDASVSLQPAEGGSLDNAYAQAVVELDCLRLY